ncbi:MAG TPA: protein-L-isoaspartate(D-aspartate) O-methyltransferase [Bacteroidales bacterium]|nr:protein-L-isoaspartate(D-aspartate) O-methyltransferase [Bacteroidales bacterium]HPT12289.1 protein-L-isoaspartate(D-aspartate) O-methyltransferase [Bacteroidales bacterium]
MKIFPVIFLSILFCINAMQKDMFESLRYDMVETQLVSRGIKDAATLEAMRKVPRHLFVPAALIDYAYDDGPMQIGYGQTISQPYIVAYMTEYVVPTKNKKALEIGTGSGYQAAVLAETVDSVYTIEIVPQLAASSAERLKRLGYNNVIVKEGDGYQGWPEHGPYDIIMVTAAADEIPQPLVDQLAEGGRLIMPLGKPHEVQKLILLRKKNGEIRRTMLTLVRFVPLTRSKGKR